MAAEQPGYFTNKPKGYMWLSSTTNFFNPFNAATPASSATYRTNLGMSEMPKYSKYTICVKQFQLDANNTVAAPGVAAFTDLRDEDGNRVFSCAVCIAGLPREKNTIGQPNHVIATAAANAIRQTHLENAYLLFDGANSANGYSSTERPTTPKYVVSNAILGPQEIQVSIRSTIGWKLVSGGWNVGAGIGLRALPNWTMCLEVEGIDGFEEFAMSIPRAPPLMTNGVNTANQAGFVDYPGATKKSQANKKGGGTLIGY